jgi:hypothetical protein
MRFTTALLCTLPALVAATAPSPAAEGDPDRIVYTVEGPAPDSPIGAIRRLAWAYENKRLEEYGRLFTADFRFHFSDPDLIDIYPEGWCREDELASAQHLFEGFVNPEGRYLPAAESIELTMADPEESAVISGQASRAHRRVLVPSVRLVVRLPGGALIADRQPHEFWLVRGDEAALGEGRAACLECWYVYKWVESPAEIAPTEEYENRGSGGLAALDTARQGLRFALHPITPNPCRQPVFVSFVLVSSEVAHLQVFDAQGRLCSTSSVGHLGPGPHRVVLRQRLAPGIYWIRLRQGVRMTSTKLVALP